MVSAMAAANVEQDSRQHVKSDRAQTLEEILGAVPTAETADADSRPEPAGGDGRVNPVLRQHITSGPHLTLRGLITEGLVVGFGHAVA